MTLSNSVSLMSVSESYSGDEPALFTNTSTPPRSSHTVWANAVHWSQSVTWRAYGLTRPPVSSVIRAAAASHASSFREAMTTCAPREENARAISYPRPRDPPVMTTVRSVKSNAHSCVIP